jgi:endonuclease/exonuclease/phosphatase (EEP) superfamily protein YafD
MLVAVFLGSIAGFIGHIHRYIELASHFKLQYLMVAVACLLICVALQAWWSALYATFTVLINLVVVLPWYIPPAKVPLTKLQSSVKILFANVESTNKNPSDLIGLVIEEDPDMLIIQEATQRWVNQLKVLEERLPYGKALPRSGGLGLALYSRLPVERVDVIALGRERIPGLVAQLHRGPRVLSVVTVHPRPPLQSHYFQQRNEQLRDAAAIVQALPAPKILVGDFNTSPWSPYYSHLIRLTRLYNARKGFGLLPTWPTFMPSRFLMIPIDHCLVSPDISVIGMRAGRNIGSDHLPIIVDMRIPG